MNILLQKRVEALFKTNFKDYDNFRIEKIAEYEKEGPLTIEKIKYQVTPWDMGDSGLVFSALMIYEKYDRDEMNYEFKDVIDE